MSLYDNLSRLLVEGPDGLPRLEGREHTAQVEGMLREIREERFRFEEDDVRKLGERGAQLLDYREDNRFLPILFLLADHGACSGHFRAKELSGINCSF